MTNCVTDLYSLISGNRCTMPCFQVTSHQGPDELKEAVEGCDAVAIPAGVPRKPGIFPQLISSVIYAESYRTTSQISDC